MARKPSAATSRTLALQQKVLEYLTESGNVSYSCKRTGISRETYYNWRENRVFAYLADTAIDFGKSFVNDLAHTQLIRNIQEGDMRAIVFQLASCHPDYQPRRARMSEEDRPVTVTAINIIPALPKPDVEGS